MESKSNTDLTWEAFEKVEMRVGTILTVAEFKEARNPAYKMTIDFGSLGIKKTSAQVTALYSQMDLIGSQVVAIVNFPPKQIATMMSECLVLGALGTGNEVTLLQPGMAVKNGARIS